MLALLMDIPNLPLYCIYHSLKEYVGQGGIFPGRLEESSNEWLNVTQNIDRYRVHYCQDFIFVHFLDFKVTRIRIFILALILSLGAF